MHLAQLNVARLLAPIDDPRITEFRDALGPVNALAEVSPGFVWRLAESDDDPTALVQHDFGDFAVTYSVWDSRESLWNFVYRSGHLDYLRRRLEWFHRNAEVSSVMWWVEEGVIPSLAEGIERLTHLRAHGPSPAAFTFKQFYDSSEAANLPAAAEVRK
ncbi:MAG: DUF3291 domain-containing protein [Nonomuraea sp.]|nr:DUF3291 domain-containing protein [Nonomuraea sp.]